MYLDSAQHSGLKQQLSNPAAASVQLAFNLSSTASARACFSWLSSSPIEEIFIERFLRRCLLGELTRVASTVAANIGALIVAVDYGEVQLSKSEKKGILVLENLQCLDLF